MKEKKRLLQMLYALAASDRPMRSEDLAKICGVSIRTVKSDVIELSDLARASGAELCSKTGTGFWLEITDPEAFAQVRDQLSYQFSYTTFTSEYENKVNVFARRLLVSGGYTTIRELADELWLARSTIKPFVKEVRTLLSKFRLDLISKAPYGLKVEGLEINRRFCMLELYLNHDMRSQTLIGNQEFRDYLDVDPEDAARIRRIVLRELRKSPVRIRDQMSHRLIRYMRLAQTRSRNGFPAEIPEEVRPFLNNPGIYDTAAGIIGAVREVFPDIPQNEEEILALEYLLLIFIDPVGKDGITPLRTAFSEEIREAVDFGLQEVISEWNCPEHHVSDLKERLNQVMIPVYAQLLFPAIGYSFIGKEIENNSGSPSPLSNALANSFLHAVSRKYQSRVSRFSALYLSLPFFEQIEKIRYPYRKRNIIIACRMGFFGAGVIRNALKMHFGEEAFGKLDFCELYEGREIDLSRYDCMIGTHEEFYYKYSIPYLRVSSSPKEEDMEKIRLAVIRKGYDMQSAAEKLDLHFRMPANVPIYKNREDFAEKIGGLMAAEGRRDELVRAVLETRDTFIWNHTLCLIAQPASMCENTISLWEYERSYVWEGKLFHKVLFFCADMGKDELCLKAFEQLVRKLCEDKFFEMLKKDPSADTVCRVIESAII